MLPRLPRRTRIILLPEDERRSRELVITREMVLGLTLLVVVLMTLMALVMISYGRLVREAGRVRQLQGQLTEARTSLAGLQDIEDELEQTRALQEQLLVMLGVEPDEKAMPDTLAWSVTRAGAEPSPSLQQVANVVMTPPPDLWPMAGFVTGEFAEGNQRRGIVPHLGMDLVAPLGTPVKAAGRGRVSNTGWDDYLGNFVEIQHGFGYVTMYGHCDSLLVSKGDPVDRGQVIGTMGGTGHASAPHLHFEVWKDGVAIDPRSIIPGDPSR